MRTFSLFITDTRYAVLTLALLDVSDERQAIALADATLDASNFHRAVELHDGQRTIYQHARVVSGGSRPRLHRDLGSHHL